MTSSKAIFAAVVALSFSWTAQGQSFENDWDLTPPTVEPFIIPAAFSLQVTDVTGHPVAGASVMIGLSPNVPFADNTLITDQDGRVNLPTLWLDAQPVTIEAQGFVRATYMAVQPSMSVLQIRSETKQQATQARFELTGTSSGFGKLKDDGIFDLGMIIQGITRAGLSSISLTSLISPEVDHFTVMGQSVDVPSNITMPDQTESYIFPLRFNKPGYRLYLPSDGAWKVSALHVRVPFKTMLDAVQNGQPFTDLVNNFDFREGSINDVTISQPSTSLDLAVNTLPFTKSIPFQAPTFDPGLNLLAISLAQSSGSYFPTDVKNVPSGKSVLLAAPAGTMTDGMVLAAYKKAGTKSVGPATDQYSAVTLPNNESRPFDPIRLVNPPQATDTSLVLDTPDAGADLQPVMTYALLNVVTTITKGKLKMEGKQAQWDVWAPNWVTTLTLPQRPLPSLGPDQKLRWEVGFSAQFIGQKSAQPGPGALEKITHVTRSAVEL